MRTALLALALSPTLAVVPCSSDKPDDVDTEGCYGWCSAAFAADHCGWWQKSPSNPPSNPSSFKKLSTTEDL